MNTQPEPLRLADALQDYTACTLAQMDQAADCLRRLHEQNEILREALKTIVMHSASVQLDPQWAVDVSRSAIIKTTKESK